MGIKDLWSIFNSHAERKPLCDLQGKLVAVDLAGWVCENLNVVDYNVNPRLYLRNLFFRISFLLQNDIIPVFVLEGDVPTLKYSVIAKRNAMQFRGAKPRENHNPNPIDVPTQSYNAKNARSRFNHVLQKCEDLITAMGLECVTGPGEAEAYCAYLNKRGFVDGVLSQDSDCFAYGARKVYRHFSISQQGNSAAQGGSVDEYDMAKIEKSTGIGQNKIIVLALLAGCDYGPGVDGVGRDSILKLFNEYSENEILDRVKSWRTQNDYYSEMEMKVDNKMVCVNCGHLGRSQQHSKSGCIICKMNHGCDSSLWKEKRLSLKAELTIRRKALSDPEFPSANIFKEFFQNPPKIDNLNLKWKQPKLVKFVNSLSKELQWNELYSFQKIFPLLTRWLLMYANAEHPIFKCLKPAYIKKRRAPKGIKSYEIVWDKSCSFFTSLIPQDQIDYYLVNNTIEIETLYSTIESEIYVDKIFPELVETFSASKRKPPTKKRKLKTSLNNLNNKLIELSNIEKPPRSPIKRRKQLGMADDPEQQQITNFLRKRETKNLLNLTPINLSQLNLTIDDDSTNDQLNISQAITNFIKATPKKIYFKGKLLVFPKSIASATSRPEKPNKIEETKKSSTPILGRKNPLKISILNELSFSFNEFDNDNFIFN